MKFWPIVIAIAVASTAVVGGLFLAGAFNGTGTLIVKVHDAPCVACSHVWVTFQSAAVHQSDVMSSEWVTLNVSNTTVDLMALNGTALAKVIGVASLKAGHYQQVRLTVSNVAISLANGTNVTASIPTATSADLNSAFTVASGATTTLSIDIDLATSLHVEVGGPHVNVTFTPNLGSVVVT